MAAAKGFALYTKVLKDAVLDQKVCIVKVVSGSNVNVTAFGNTNSDVNSHNSVLWIDAGDPTPTTEGSTYVQPLA